MCAFFFIVPEKQLSTNTLFLFSLLLTHTHFLFGSFLTFHILLSSFLLPFFSPSFFSPSFCISPATRSLHSSPATPVSLSSKSIVTPPSTTYNTFTFTSNTHSPTRIGHTHTHTHTLISSHPSTHIIHIVPLACWVSIQLPEQRQSISFHASIPHLKFRFLGVHFLTLGSTIPTTRQHPTNIIIIHTYILIPAQHLI